MTPIFVHLYHYISGLTTFSTILVTRKVILSFVFIHYASVVNLNELAYLCTTFHHVI